MSMVKISVIENVFTQGEKQEMIEKVTDAMLSVEGGVMRGTTSVIVEEVHEGAWGIGGKALTSSDIHKLQAGTV